MIMIREWNHIFPVGAVLSREAAKSLWFCKKSHGAGSAPVQIYV
jgi:hypothetical protein